ncbi:MAG: FAD:protein FMN transferase [Pirellula sp.]
MNHTLRRRSATGDDHNMRPGDRRWTRREFTQQTAWIAGLSWGILAMRNHAIGTLFRDDAFESEFPSMGSTIQLRWVSEKGLDPVSILRGARELADQWVDILSDYQQDSQCNQLCRDADGGSWTFVSDGLWEVIVECDRWHRISEGAFDASLGALTRLRRSHRDATEEQWERARAQCGWDQLELDHGGHRIRFLKSGLRLDFGAIGKGFVVDRIGQYLRGIGIDSFSVNASGNMCLGDTPNRGDREHGWPIAIGAIGNADRELLRLRLAGCGIATSGDLFQKYRDGTREETTAKTSHIVDPALRRGLVSSQMATVITKSATDADAMATACCVHMQRGSVNGWLDRCQSSLPTHRLILQYQDEAGGGIRLTTVGSD